MLSTRIRTAIVASAALAALSIPGAAGAAVLVRSPGTATPIRVVQPTTATPLKEAGSAGVKGYDDKKCESLLNTYEQNRGAAENYVSYGDYSTALATAEYAGAVKEELESNCLTVD